MDGYLNINTLDDLKSYSAAFRDKNPEKLFEIYKLVREFAFFIFKDFLIKDKELYKNLIFEAGRFLGDVLIIDKSFINNAIHFVNIKLDDAYDDLEKAYLIQNLDSYIYPRDNKRNPDIYKFASGFMIYHLSYKNSFTSKDEARELAKHIFSLSDTDMRNFTKEIESAYSFHSSNNKGLFPMKDIVAHIMFFLILSEILDESKMTFDELFLSYQRKSKKSQETTYKTLLGYKEFKGAFLKSLSHFQITEEKFLEKFAQQIKIFDFIRYQKLDGDLRDIHEIDIACLAYSLDFDAFLGVQ